MVLKVRYGIRSRQGEGSLLQGRGRLGHRRLQDRLWSRPSQRHITTKSVRPTLWRPQHLHISIPVATSLVRPTMDDRRCSEIGTTVYPIHFTTLALVSNVQSSGRNIRQSCLDPFYCRFSSFHIHLLNFNLTHRTAKIVSSRIRATFVRLMH